MVSRWTAHLALEVEVAPGAAQDVQPDWAGIRALAALAALTRVLTGACEDMTGGRFTVADMDGERVHAFLNDCMDYCDQIVFNLEGPPWIPSSAVKDLLKEETALALTASWQEYCQAPSNLPLQQFVQALMG
ncbi:MAG: hypothetical protein QN189_12635 [Armatimonadota bacterium]|nr:hypothetical protein [Armatimonadota bacterium]